MTNTLLEKLNRMQDAPLLCVPLVAADTDGLLRDAAAARQAGADLAEWRADLFGGGPSSDAEALAPALVPLLGRLKEALGGLPLLFTLRSRAEGGSGAFDKDTYTALCRAAVESGAADMLDIEYAMGPVPVAQLAAFAAARGVVRVVSRHYFSHTPAKDAMARELLAMRATGADLPKLAVMPAAPEDVTALLDATAAYTRAHGPAITMAMGRLGAFSRVAGGLYGSRVSFASLNGASAPGQVPIADMRQMLRCFYPGGGNDAV